MRRFLCFALCCIMLLTTTSCAANRTPEVYNTSSYALELDDYVVLQNSFKLPIMINKDTWECEIYYYDPIKALDSAKQFTRYAKDGRNTVAITQGIGFYDVYSIDLDTFYANTDQGLHNGSYSSYLGAEDLFPDLSYGAGVDQRASSICGMFAYGNGYLLVRNSGVFTLEGGRKSKEVCVYDEEPISTGNVAFDGRSVYYLLENYTLVKLDVKIRERTVLQKRVSDYRLTSRGVVAIVGNQLLLLNDKGEMVTQLAEDAYAVGGGTEEYVYYCKENESTLARVRWDGSDARVLPLEGYFHSLGIINDPARLLYYGKDGTYHLCNYDGEEDKTLSLTTS